MDGKHWQNWLIGIIGVWLVASNWVLGYAVPQAGPPTLGASIFWNAIVTGVAAIVMAGMALAAFQLWEEWADIAIGLWLVASPWVLGFADIRAAMWNVVLCGLAIILSGAWMIYEVRETGHA